MKTTRKVLSLVLALVMVLALAVTASAAGETGTIKITNAADGATYEFYKLFDAKVAGNGPIAYTGDIPAGLDKYFQKDTYGQITAKAEEMTEQMKKDLLAWTKTATATYTKTGTEAKAGVTVEYGYYVIVSNVGEGTAVTVDSTNPDVEVIDKNTTTTPVWSGDDDGKEVNGTVFQMGETATYTVTLKTVNWVADEDASKPAKKVIEYTISDDFAGGKLTNVNVTSIMIGTDDVTKQFEGGKIVLPWVDDDGESKYAEGVDIIITYTATVNDTGVITNKVSATYKTLGDSTPVPVEGKPEATVYNSTINVNKYTGNDKDDADTKLANAKFVLKNAEGKFYNLTAGNVVEWVDEANAKVVTTDKDGFAEFKGLEDGRYALLETEAPDGYNKLTGEVTIDVNAATDPHTVSYTGDVQNNIGAELPSTGGIGTTIFTVVGGILMAGAAVLYITKKRSEDAGR